MAHPHGATAAAGLGLGNGDTACGVGAVITGDPGTAVNDLVLLVAVDIMRRDKLVRHHIFVLTQIDI